MSLVNDLVPLSFLSSDCQQTDFRANQTQCQAGLIGPQHGTLNNVKRLGMGIGSSIK